MTGCKRDIPFAALVDWWFDDHDASSLDEHVLECAACARSLEWLADVTDAADAMIAGGIAMRVVPGALLDRLAARGLRIREYRMGPGGSIECTITPDDDLVVTRLIAPLAGVNRVDVFPPSIGAGPERIDDVPFDPATGEVILMPPPAMLRKLDTHTAHARLVAVDAAGQERVLGDYTFHHRRWSAGA